jgi:hypothetical protein
LLLSAAEKKAAPPYTAPKIVDPRVKQAQQCLVLRLLLAVAVILEEQRWGGASTPAKERAPVFDPAHAQRGVRGGADE